MKSGLLLRLGALAGATKLAAAECPNACSGRGMCGAYDMCTCYTGYMGNDCSERVCPFGLAHVDSPKGDLDMDNDVDSSTILVGSQMYSAGTSELFPTMKTSAQLADPTAGSLEETAHYYMECSNKGLCDRTTATCTCFTGYEGTSCQRTSCPNDCSGHGVCRTNRELARGDHDNIYELWDADMSLACDCDAGYGGYDCSEKNCPYGIDPLFIDDKNTARMPEWTIFFEDAADLANAGGTWALKFYDVWGEDWITDPIDFNGDNTVSTFVEDCEKLTAALASIPNDVITFQSDVECAKSAGQDGTTSLYYVTYKLKFIANPGAHRIPELIVMDEAGRHTLVDDAGSTNEYAGLDTAVIYDTGITGEFYDYFAKKCGVTVTIMSPVDFYELSAADGGYAVPTGTGVGGSGLEVHYGEVQRAIVASDDLRPLKECLSDSDGVPSNNVGVENWDFGNLLGDFGPVDANGGGVGTIRQSVPAQYPHLVKLVADDASVMDGGVYTIMTWHPDDDNFVLSAAVDPSLTYQVFATDGVLERVWYDKNGDGVFEMYGANHGDEDYDEMGLAYWNQYEDVIYTSHDFSCENAGYRGDGEPGSGMPVFYDGSSYLHNNCLEKGDFLVLPSFTTSTYDKDTLGNLDPAYGDTQTKAQATENTAGLYEIMKISVEDWDKDTNTTENRFQIKLDRPIFWDASEKMVNDLDEETQEPATGIRNMFRFIPDMGSPHTAEWVAPCSNRGLCDLNSGLCSCFAGYTGENCDMQSALAV